MFEKVCYQYEHHLKHQETIQNQKDKNLPQKWVKNRKEYEKPGFPYDSKLGAER